MKQAHKIALAMALAVSVATSAAFGSVQVPKIDLNKIELAKLMTGPYSYFVPPYSYYYFQHMDRLGYHVDWIHRAGPIYPLQEPKAAFTTTYRYKGKQYTLAQYYQRNAVTGFLVLKDNQIISERYFHGSNIHSRFLSNSVGKSITSTLVGIAIDEGKMASINDRVIKYLPALNMSGYNRVSVKDALEMASANLQLADSASGVGTNDYHLSVCLLRGQPSFTDFLKTVKANPKLKPGRVFDYQNADTEVLGLALQKATGAAYNDYLQARLWGKIGAQSDAFLYRAKKQQDPCTFGCLSATLRDYGRFGLMMMNGGTLGANRLVSEAWVKQATTPKLAADASDSYGYQWWIPKDIKGAYEANGIFGQIIYINPSKHVVIVETSAWPEPDPDERWAEANKVMDAIATQVSP